MATAHLTGDLTADDVAGLAEHFEPLRAEELVEFAAEQFGGRMVLTCSWQLGTSILVHMTREVAPQTRLVEIDTGLLFAETHATRERLVDHYGLEVETLRPLQSVEQQAAAHGGALWERDPDALLRAAQGRAARARDPRRRRLADRHPPRSDAPARERAEARATTRAAASSRCSRWSTGASRTAGATSIATASRTTSCTIAASRRSAARPARVRRRAARTRAPAAGPAPARPSAACTPAEKSADFPDRGT